MSGTGSGRGTAVVKPGRALHELHTNPPSGPATLCDAPAALPTSCRSIAIGGAALLLAGPYTLARAGFRATPTRGRSWHDPPLLPALLPTLLSTT